MLKGLAILAVFLAVARTLVPVSGQAPDGPRHNSQEQNRSGNGSQNPTPNAARAISQDDSGTPQGAESKEGSTHYQQPAINVTEATPVPESWSWHDIIGWAANVSLCIFAGITLCYFIVQTKATKEAADAALLNAQALIASERPWIVVELEHSPLRPLDEIIVYGVNKGNTPAEVIEGHCTCKGHPFGFQPSEGMKDPIFAPNQALTVGGDRFQIRVISKRYCAEQTANQTQICLLYGKILYWDTFTNRDDPSSKPHVTQWILAYDVDGDGFRRYASDFTRHT